MEPGKGHGGGLAQVQRSRGVHGGNVAGDVASHDLIGGEPDRFAPEHQRPGGLQPGRRSREVLQGDQSLLVGAPREGDRGAGFAERGNEVGMGGAGV